MADDTMVPGKETSKLFQIKLVALLFFLTKKPAMTATMMATGEK